MACEAIQSWTFTSLVAAFLDLFITYLLLCASTLAFFASNFLSIFGLCLPCPCDGLFSDPNSRNCLQRFLIDSPIKTISSVQMSVKNKFPFDSILMRDHQGRRLNVKLLEMEGEASCSSSSDARLQKKNELVRFGSLNLQQLRKGIEDSKGKGFLNHRPRPGSLRRRRRAPADGNRRIGRESSQSPFGSGRIGQEIVEDTESSVQHDNETHVGIHSDTGPQQSFQWDVLMGESKNFGKDESSASDVVRNVQHKVGSDRSEVHATRVLEQALEEEHAARAELYQELEKERSAAASAADEAMAMILRLQKEKASTEMEARQYQRMIEEKSAYDAEEMNILKEILVRREREKYFLEKEVEAYRHMLTPGSEEVVGMSTQRPRMSFDSSEDPSLMLQQLSEYIDKKEMIKNMNNSSKYDASTVEKNGRVLAFGEESLSPRWHEIDNLLKRGDSRRRSVSNEDHLLHEPTSVDECKQEFQEKRLLFREEHPSDAQGPWLVAETDSSFHMLNGSQELSSHEKTIVVDEEQEKNDNARQCQGLSVKNDQIPESGISFPGDSANQQKHGTDADQDGIDHYNSSFGAELTVLDVHVIDDKSELCNRVSERAAESLLMNTATDRCRNIGLRSEISGLRSVNIYSDLPNTSRGDTRDIQPAVRRSMSDMRSVLDKSQGKALLSDMRRNSMSSVNYEKLKLESEVEFLTERLKIVQEGREKLSFSVEHKEREKMHLQLLEDIARQLRDIRQLTEPGNVRQASLPPPSSKASSKKRRCRSVSIGIHGSSS